MIVLKRLTEPREADLSDTLPGFKVRLRRLRPTDLRAVETHIIDTLTKARQGLGALAEYGLDRPDEAGRLLNVFDVFEMTRIGHLIASVELALCALISWEGVTLEDGTLAPITRETLALLLFDEKVERRVLHEITEAARVVQVVDGPAAAASPAGQ